MLVDFENDTTLVAFIKIVVFALCILSLVFGYIAFEVGNKYGFVFWALVFGASSSFTVWHILRKEARIKKKTEIKF